MKWRNLVVPVLGVVLVFFGWRMAGWGGVALAAGALFMYLLLHFNRVMHVMRKAASRPKGRVGSAVMLNAKLKPGLNLLHVMALTNSLGEPLTTPGEDPEVFRWTDGTDSSVTCEFTGGKLVKWALARPQGEPGTGAGAEP